MFYFGGEGVGTPYTRKSATLRNLAARASHFCGDCCQARCPESSVAGLSRSKHMCVSLPLGFTRGDASLYIQLTSGNALDFIIPEPTLRPRRSTTGKTPRRAKISRSSFRKCGGRPINPEGTSKRPPPFHPSYVGGFGHRRRKLRSAAWQSKCQPKGDPPKSKQRHESATESHPHPSRFQCTQPGPAHLNF